MITLELQSPLHKLGDVAILRGDSKQGIEFLQESLKMQRSLHGDRNHAGVAITLRKLGDVMAQTGDVAQALEKLQESAEVNRSLYGEKDHPNVADVLHSLGKANQRAGDFEQAEKFLEQSLADEGVALCWQETPQPQTHLESSGPSARAGTDARNCSVALPQTGSYIIPVSHQYAKILDWARNGGNFHPSHSATQPLCQSGWRSHSATQSLRVADWLSGWSRHSHQSGWVAEWPGWMTNFLPLVVT